jgi:hypothetical protein
MKFTSVVGALGASILLLSGAGAIDLDVKSPGTRLPPRHRIAY